MVKAFPRLPLPTLLLSLSVVFSSLSAFADEQKLVELESIDGRKITVELIEKSKDKVRFKQGLKFYILSFDKLSKDSAALVKNAIIPPICDFELVGDFTKRTIKHSTSKEICGCEGEIITVYSSYRTDTISGKVVVKNDAAMENSPAAHLKIVTLAKSGNNIYLLNQVSHAVPQIEPLKNLEFSIGAATTRDSYYGYIAALYVDDHLVAIKSIPATYERDPLEAVKFLGVRK